MLNYALRVNLTMAIVEMVQDPKQSSVSVHDYTQNDTSNEIINGLSSASHTLPISTTEKPFQNLTETDTVSYELRFIFVILFLFCLFFNEQKKNKQKIIIMCNQRRRFGSIYDSL